MTDGERDPAVSGDWPLGEMIRQAMQGRSENSIAKLAETMGPDYKISRQTLRNYTYGFREGGGRLVVTADTVRRIAAVLELDARQALIAAGLPDEAERQPPKTRADAPLDSKEELADKVALLSYDDRAALQQLIDSLVARTDDPTQDKRVRITSVSGGEAWRGHRSTGGTDSEMPAREAHN